jgi:hypothetical protein
MAGDPLAKVKTGDQARLPAEAFNAFADSARQSRQHANDVGRAAALPDMGLQQMLVQSQTADHLICHRLDSAGLSGGVEQWDEGSVDVYVRKPPTLQRTRYDGLTIAGKSYSYSSNSVRTVTSGDTTERQQITEDYLSGFTVIYAALCNAMEATDPDDTSSERTPLVDINLDGRAWAMVEDDS